MENKFLDYNGLEVYDEKLKAYINKKIDEVINIQLFGNRGFSLTGQGNDGIPVWAQNSGFRLCASAGEQVIKMVNSVNYEVENGGIFAIKFAYSHTVEENAQLSINGITAPLYWKDGLPVTNVNSWEVNETLEICYDNISNVVIPKFVILNTPLSKSHPIGSIYISTVDTNPSLLFGGTWEQIKDTFLLTAGDTYNAGETGGSADAVVVYHDHTVGVNGGTGFEETKEPTEAGTSGIGLVNGSAAGRRIRRWAASGEVYPIGEDGTGKNMPPYLVVYAWKRIKGDIL